MEPHRRESQLHRYKTFTCFITLNFHFCCSVVLYFVWPLFISVCSAGIFSLARCFSSYLFCSQQYPFSAFLLPLIVSLASFRVKQITRKSNVPCCSFSLSNDVGSGSSHITRPRFAYAGRNKVSRRQTYEEHNWARGDDRNRQLTPRYSRARAQLLLKEIVYWSHINVPRESYFLLILYKIL